MAQSYPIWNDIDACIYASSKSYGVRDTGVNKIKVGSSAVNSFDFLTTTITHREQNNIKTFKFSIDGVVIATAIYNKKTKDFFVKKHFLVQQDLFL